MSVHQQQWFFSSGGERYGPVGFDYLIELAKSGKLDPRNDMVWTTTLSDWEPAGEVEGLFERRAPTNDVPSMSGDFASTGNFESKPIPKAHFPGTGRIGYVMGTAVLPLALMVGWAFAVPLMLPYVPDGYKDYLPPVIIPLVGILILATLVKRFRNLGMTGWWVLGLMIPILNIWLGYRLLACPGGYAVVGKLDFPGKLVAVLYWGTLVAGIGLGAAAGVGAFGESADAAKWQDIMTQLNQLWKSGLPER
ncbi:GYF domain-containing protein [Luteolibacter flavescens]|uniref:GYF domain-containing protein n=1 Tax=Luteolibacter flavescens TaxID=1859460 RepID=A0ABT3FSD6_9BACT|nr:GYF domain-containing protein [Luteolibacter flavescens]MCW1886114.1 GYF domain-containing protein [Luteolibacter flavescens]